MFKLEHRRPFSPQFKAEAVQMVVSTGRPAAEVARDLGIHNGTLGNWVNAWRREHPEPDEPLSPVERAGVKKLEDEGFTTGSDHAVVVADLSVT